MALPLAAAGAAMGSSGFGSAFTSGLGQGVAGSVASAGQGLLGQLFGGWTARRQWKYVRKQMELQQKYQLEQMQKQYDYAIQRFDYENAYNEPSKVFERYAAAGINPAAVLGSSGASLSGTMPGAGTTSSTGMPSAPGTVGQAVQPHASGLGNPVAAAQIEQANSASNLNNATAENQRSQSRYYEQLSENQVDVRLLLRAQVGQTEADTILKRWQGLIGEIDYQNHRDMIDAQLTKIFQEIDTLASTQKVNEETARLVQEKTLSEVAYRSVLDSEAKHNQALVRFLEIMSDDKYAQLQAGLRKNTLLYKNPSTGDYEYYTLSRYEAECMGAMFASMRESFDSWTGKVTAGWATANQVRVNITDYLNSATNVAGSATGAVNTYNDIQKRIFNERISRARWSANKNNPRAW